MEKFGLLKKLEITSMLHIGRYKQTVRNKIINEITHFISLVPVH